MTELKLRCLLKWKNGEYEILKVLPNQEIKYIEEDKNGEKRKCDKG